MVGSNFPAQPTVFLGRARELTGITALLANPSCRLLTLVGPGGIGKTRLAMQAAQNMLTHSDAEGGDESSLRASARFADGAYFIPLQPLVAHDGILSAVAEAVGFQFYPCCDPRQELFDFLSAKALILILDNFEHLLDGASFVSDLLANAPHVKIVVTSREILNLQEEWLFPVKGMPFPAHDVEDSGGPEQYEQYSAVQLFVQSARRARPDFSFEAEQSAVLRICQLVGGIPLALEMTAAWLKRLPMQEIVQELERGLDILQNPARNIPSRHWSMRAVFAESWNLLTDVERDVFKKLSVFRGGFSRDAAEKVVEASLGVLSALVDKSLLQMDPSGRYDLHELLRQYATEQLDASPETGAQLHEHHSRYYLGLIAQRAWSILIIRPHQTSINELADELENIRVAWDWAIDHQNLRLIVQSGSLLGGFYHYLCKYQEGEALFDKAVQKLRGCQDRVLMYLMSVQGWFAQYLAQYDKAEALLRKSLTIARRRRDVKTLEFCLLRLSEIATQRGNYEQARLFAEEELESQKRTGPDGEWVITFSLTNLGKIVGLSGDFAEAKRLFKEAIEASRRYNVPVGTADALNYLGYMELKTEAYQDARNTFLENLAPEREIDYFRGQVASLIGLGEAARGLGEYPESHAYFFDALRLALRVHEIPRALDAFAAIADLLLHENNQEGAIELLGIVMNHQATTYETRHRAIQLVEQAEKQVPAYTVGAIVERGRTAQIEQVARALLERHATTASENQAEPHPAQPGTADHLSKRLSERELEILRLVAEGFSNREIAERLFLAVGTVKWYMSEIYGKLHVASRTRAVARARELNLVT